MSAWGLSSSQLSGAPPIASDGMPAVPSPAELAAWQVSAARPPSLRRGTGVLLTVFAVLLIAACGLAIALLIGSATGRVGFVLGGCLAALPVPLLIWCFRWLDRYEPEPWRVMLFTLGWGAAVATLIAIFLNEVGGDVLFGTGQGDDLIRTAVFVAPPVEEFAKGAVIAILALRHRVNSVVDGVVLAGMTGVGFAFTENILYLGRSYSELSDQFGRGTGILGVIIVFVLRGVISPFAHPLFTMATGVGIAVAATTRRKWLRWVAPVAGYAVAITLHGTWNAMASRGLGGFALAYVVIMVPVFAIGVSLALWLRRREGRLLARRLPPFAEAGWIAPHEVAVLSSLWLRGLFADVASFLGGQRGRRATVDYHDLLTTLAFQREQLANGRQVERTVREQMETLAALPYVRASAYVPPPPFAS